MFPEFTDYLEYLELEQESAANTLDVRERELRRFSEWLNNEGIEDIDAVSSRDISSYVDHLAEEGFAEKTIVATKYSSISVVFNYLENRRMIEDNPVARIERKSIKKKARKAMSEDEKKGQLGAKDHLTKAEVYELAENAPDPSDRNELLIKLMFWTGLRVSEVVRIDIGEDGAVDGKGSDIDPEEPKIVVYSPKTDEPRVVSYPRSEINPLLRDWVNHGRLRYKCADRTDRLFAAHKGPITESGVGRVVDLAAQNMGIQEVKRESVDGREYKRVTPHLLRHSHAMHYHNEEDISLDKIKDHLGHANLQTTERFYAESTNEAMIDTFGE